MKTKYYVTVHGGSEGTWIAEKAGEQIKQNAAENLRGVRLHHAYDYEGFNISGVLMQRGATLDLARVEQWVSLEQGALGVKDSRMVITDGSLAAGSSTAFGLVLEITAGDQFSWARGRNGVNAVITVDAEHRAAKVGASIQDIFQDIMLANDDSVQAVLSKWRTAGGTDAALFARKAAFATAEVAAGRAGGVFARFDADAYASFAAISRLNFNQTMGPGERRGFAALWTRFLTQEFAEHFLDVEEAVRLVTKGRFRTAKKELTAGSGTRPDARIPHGMLSESELKKALSDEQLVRNDGSYILCFWLTTPGDSANRIGALFDWSNSSLKRPNKFKLVDEEGYTEMLPLVRDGLVTPIRLFPEETVREERFMSNFIGIVDLTVRHSSMNPLGYIDVHEAAITFERLMLYACTEALRRHGPDDARTKAMIERGIVTQGGAAKLFQFDDAADALAFATHLRSLLVEKQLPFKLCLTKGDLGAQSLREVWMPVLNVAKGERDEEGRNQAKRDLLRHFNTVEPDEIEELFKAYRVPGFHQDEVSLALDLDAFKGFGIWIDEALATGAEAIKDVRLFRNYHPIWTSARARPDRGEFFDLRFAIDEDDVVGKQSGRSAPVALPTGQAPRIASIVDLLRRSQKAADENSIYYVSLLATIVRSSHFGKMHKLQKATEATADSPGLAVGWQDHPPIVQSMLVDQGARQLFRRVHGLELVLGAIIDEVHAAQTSGSPSCGVVPPGPQVDGIETQAVLDPEGTFAELVKTVETIYGQQMLRKIWAIPDGVLNRQRKTAALKVTTDR